MFVALEVADPRFSGIFGNVLNILTKPKPRLETRKAMDAVYGVITASGPIHEADWLLIAELAGRYAGRMLIPEGFEPPPPLKTAEFPNYERRVILETAVEIIRRTRMPMYRRIAGLVDNNGEYASFLFPLLHHYTTVKVLTGKAAAYIPEAERMMEELGAPVVICEDYAALSDCVIIIAPDGVGVSGRLPCPVLAAKPPDALQHSDFITDLQVLPGSGIAALCPAGIEPSRYLAALYEFCGVEPSGFVAERMVWRYRKSDLTEIVRDMLNNIL